MTINAFSSVSSTQGDTYQSTITYRSHSHQALRYSNSEGETTTLEQSRSSSMAYQLSINNGGVSESLVYSRQYSQTTQVAKVEKIEETPLLDGANNILRFIEQRLAAEAEAGATEDELSELIKQGLAGFKQGYGEAIDLLKVGDSFSEKVEDSVSTLYSQVLNGFDDLKQQYNPTETPVDKDVSATPNETQVLQAQAPVSIQSTASSQTRLLRFSSIGGVEQLESLKASTLSSQRIIDDIKLVEPPQADKKTESLEEFVNQPSTTVPYASEQTRVEYGLKERFSFTLQTQDGDKVTINARNTLVYAARYDEQSDVDGQQSQFVEGLKTNESYTFSIEGELDDDEKQAINELMGQVMSLADTFYNGNVDAAYEQALAVGYDQDEIASYSFNMKQVEQYSVTNAYQTFAPETTERPSLNGVFDLIGDYTSQLIDQLNKPQEGQNIDFVSLLKSIAEQLDEQVTHIDGTGFKQSISPFIDG